MFFLLFVVSGLIGAFWANAKNKNVVLWGTLCFFFPVIGLVFLALAKSEEPIERRIAREMTSAMPQPHYDYNRVRATTPPQVVKPADFTSSYDRAKWNALQEVDAEIGSAVARLKPFGQKYVDQLAEKFLVLNDKQYLGTLTEK